ncbi:hypothetical protein [Microcoleus sp. herbarium14]|uniref:hypothetical protein n=1 Tax=Microcoleus sp. herbarium14 TaxID=3055439 RepID=UPI002FD42768
MPRISDSKLKAGSSLTPARMREIRFTFVHFHLNYREFELLHVSVSRRKSYVNFASAISPGRMIY